MDRNAYIPLSTADNAPSLSARRAWIEIVLHIGCHLGQVVALRKESVDRNICAVVNRNMYKVALRKESVDRNTNPGSTTLTFPVALRKESVDRNTYFIGRLLKCCCRSPQGERG